MYILIKIEKSIGWDGFQPIAYPKVVTSANKAMELAKNNGFRVFYVNKRTGSIQDLGLHYPLKK